LCLVGYQNHVWFLNHTMVLVLIHPWLPYDVWSSSPKVARFVVTCILLVNWQAWQLVMIVSVLVLSSLPESFFIRSQFTSTNNISSYCYCCVVMVLFWLSSQLVSLIIVFVYQCLWVLLSNTMIHTSYFFCLILWLVSPEPPPPSLYSFLQEDGRHLTLTLGPAAARLDLCSSFCLLHRFCPCAYLVTRIMFDSLIVPWFLCWYIPDFPMMCVARLLK
jgi:hypothetical protein